MAQIPQPPSAQDALVPAPLGGTREEALKRLQIGMGGVAAIVLLIGLASLIENRAVETERQAVPEAASTSEPVESSSRPDPLVEAGVVPDLPTTPTPTATQSAPILPEQGGDGGNQSED